MKKSTVILFLSLLLFSICGNFISYKIKQWHIKKTVFEEIRLGRINTPLVTIKKSSSIVWKENGKELEWKGKMYDVVKTEILPGGEVVFHCFDDSKESELIHIFNFIEKQSSSKSKNKIQFTFVFFCYTLNSSNFCVIENTSNLILYFYHSFLSDGYTDLPFTPPSLYIQLK